MERVKYNKYKSNQKGRVQRPKNPDTNLIPTTGGLEFNPVTIA